MRLAWHVAKWEKKKKMTRKKKKKKKKNAYRLWVGNPERKGPLGRPWRRWVDRIKMDRREIGWGVMDWIDLAQKMDQWRGLVNTVKKLRVPYIAGNYLSGCKIDSFSRRAHLHE
jgi:hypothetical protein